MQTKEQTSFQMWQWMGRDGLGIETVRYHPSTRAGKLPLKYVTGMVLLPVSDLQARHLTGAKGVQGNVWALDEPSPDLNTEVPARRAEPRPNMVVSRQGNSLTAQCRQRAF